MQYNFCDLLLISGELRSLINRSDKERAELQRRVEQHEIQERLKQEKEAEDRKRLAGKCFFAFFFRRILLISSCSVNSR